jgi:ABC-type transport system involved in multi-copper enzyme maturation permease subunit
VIIDQRFSEQPSVWRSWLYLVRLCFQRQARARQKVWIALALLVVMTALVAYETVAGRWTMSYWRSPRRIGPTYEELLKIITALPGSPAASAVERGVSGACQAILDQSGFLLFSRWVVFAIFNSFLLPLWSLSFATEALGGERESRTLIWLLNQPLPRPAVYLAKFAAMLPFSLSLNLGGFALLCLAAGEAGQPAFALFWDAVVWGTLAFCSLFHLMGALFRRSAIVAIVYSFFLEVILGNLPGTMKRISIGFYTRCMMFESAEAYGLEPEKPSVFMAIDGSTARGVLIGLTLVLLVIGMVAFSRSEYHDLT